MAPEIRKFPKGKIKRTYNFYGWAAVAFLFLFMGIITIASGRFEYHGTVCLEGSGAHLFGGILICFNIYFLYYLFFKAEGYEEARTDFHQLEGFSDVIDGHKTTFFIEHTLLPNQKSNISVYFYKVRIDFQKKLEIDLNVRRRDKFEFFLWKIGLTRLFDVLTGSYHFDSRYRVKTGNKPLLKKILNFKIIKLLEEFDRDYPPIRNKNGTLIITNDSVRYTEGPYSEDQRLFDPHRGVIENLFKELFRIVSAIEDSV